MIGACDAYSQAPHHSGPMLTDKAAERAMKLIMESGPAETAKGLVHEGHAILPPSKVTVIRTARRVATQQGRLHACRSQPTRRLTQWTKQQRMQFCKKNRDTSWGHVMFTDRKTFLPLPPGGGSPGRTSRKWFGVMATLPWCSCWRGRVVIISWGRGAEQGEIEGVRSGTGRLGAKGMGVRWPGVQGWYI